MFLQNTPVNISVNEKTVAFRMSNDVENFDTGRKTVDVMFGPGASGQTPASGALLVSLPFATNTSIIIIVLFQSENVYKLLYNYKTI